MAFNGSGVYELPTTSVTPAISTTTIDSSDFNTFTADLETALSLCLTEDGQNVPTGNLPMATFRHTGVGDGAALTDYASANQVVDNALTYGGASAIGTDAYAVNLAINPGAYTEGMRVQFIADVANTSACTLDVSSNGVKSIVMQDGGELPDNHIIADSIVDVQYDGVNFVIMSEANAESFTRKVSLDTTSGTEAAYTSIPSWVKRITFMLDQVSADATVSLNIRIGDSIGYISTGYNSTISKIDGATTSTTNVTNAFPAAVSVTAAAGSTGIFTLTNIVGNAWVFNGNCGNSNDTVNFASTGRASLTGTLDRIKILVSAGAFDAGQVNIFLEG